MRKGCPLHGEDPASACRPCVLWATDARYRKLWGGDALVVPELEIEVVNALEIVVNLGDTDCYTGAIDPEFFAECVPRTIAVIEAAPYDEGVTVNARVAGNALLVETDRPTGYVRVLLAGKKMETVT